MKIAFLAFACFVAVGCSSSDDGSSGGLDSSADSVAADTATAPSDSAASDSTSDSAASDSTGDSAASDSTSDSTSDAESEAASDTGATCAPGVGSSCDDANPCPSDMRCYGSGATGFCAPLMPECGGFAGVKCDASKRVCLTTSGSDLGYCATSGERTCICAKGKSITGC